LLGSAVEHSLSPELFRLATGISAVTGEYNLFSTTGPALTAITDLRIQGYTGLQVTAPFKTDIPEMLIEADDSVRSMDACNTMRLTDAGWQGTNTDIAGIRFTLEQYWQKHSNPDILLIGAGGAARAALLVLSDLYPQQSLYQYNRSQERLTTFSGWCGNRVKLLTPETGQLFDLVVNATPLARSVWGETYRLASDGLWFDMSYRRQDPLPGDNYCNGLPMLVGQAVAAYQFLLGETVDPERLWGELSGWLSSDQVCDTPE
jgi:shikimate dehydrogenase